MKDKRAKSSEVATNKGWSRREFVGTAAKGAVAGAVASSVPLFNIAHGAENLRTVGLGVSIINEIQARASQDTGHNVRGQALGYGAMFAKMACGSPSTPGGSRTGTR